MNHILDADTEVKISVNKRDSIGINYQGTKKGMGIIKSLSTQEKTPLGIIV